MGQSAFKKYQIGATTPGPTVPGDITTGSFTDLDGNYGANAITINYLKAGKLYYNFSWLVAAGGVGGQIVAGIGSASEDEIAAKIGVTVAQAYYGAVSAVYSSNSCSSFNGAWQYGGGSHYFLSGFLAN